MAKYWNYSGDMGVHLFCIFAVNLKYIPYRENGIVLNISVTKVIHMKAAPSSRWCQRRHTLGQRLWEPLSQFPPMLSLYHQSHFGAPVFQCDQLPLRSDLSLEEGNCPTGLQPRTPIPSVKHPFAVLAVSTLDTPPPVASQGEVGMTND